MNKINTFIRTCAQSDNSNQFFDSFIRVLDVQHKPTFTIYEKHLADIPSTKLFVRTGDMLKIYLHFHVDALILLTSLQRGDLLTQAYYFIVQRKWLVVSGQEHNVVVLTVQMTG